jgi:hypothetical protein
MMNCTDFEDELFMGRPEFNQLTCRKKERPLTIDSFLEGVNITFGHLLTKFIIVQITVSEKVNVPIVGRGKLESEIFMWGHLKSIVEISH